MALSASDALEVLRDCITTQHEIDGDSIWNWNAPGDLRLTGMVSADILGEDAWGFLKVTLNDGSTVCFSVMSVGGGS